MHFLRRFSCALLLLPLASALPAWADPATLQGLTRIFESRFVSGYASGKCGTNILNLVQAAKDNGLHMEEAEILMIENKGYSVFGMVNAEQARGAGGRNGPGERNWFHHAVLLYDGFIFDFDYGNEPRVDQFAQYFERMFLDENPTPGYGGFYVGRDKKLRDYFVEAHKASDVSASRNQPLSLSGLLEKNRSPE